MDYARGRIARELGMTPRPTSQAQLAALGHPVDLSCWEGGKAGVLALLDKKQPKMAVTLSGANYRSPRRARTSPVSTVACSPSGRAASTS